MIISQLLELVFKNGSSASLVINEERGYRAVFLGALWKALTVASKKSRKTPCNSHFLFFNPAEGSAAPFKRHQTPLKWMTNESLSLVLSLFFFFLHFFTNRLPLLCATHCKKKQKNKKSPTFHVSVADRLSCVDAVCTGSEVNWMLTVSWAASMLRRRHVPACCCTSASCRSSATNVPLLLPSSRFLSLFCFCFFSFKTNQMFFQMTHVSQHAPSHLSNVSFRRVSTCNLDCAVAAADTLLSSLLPQHFYKIFFLLFFFFTAQTFTQNANLIWGPKRVPLATWRFPAECFTGGGFPFTIVPATNKVAPDGPRPSREPLRAGQEDRPAGCILPCTSHLSWTC